MLARKAEAARPNAAARDSSSGLRVGAPDDASEREADRAADAVMAGRYGGAERSLSGITIEPSPRRPAFAGADRHLQRQWSDAPVGPLGGATSAVTTAPSYGWNRGEVGVGSIRRIPVEGLGLGNQSPYATSAAAEGAKGRAIVLLPDNIDLTRPVEVLLHLHGHNVGYRQRVTQSSHPSLKPGSVRDVDTDRIEQQLQASARPIIGVLPQGTTSSGFGGLNSDAYVAEVFQKLGSIGVFGTNPPPRVERVVLSGHSGGGGAIADMLSQPGQPRLPSSLGEVALFDGINGDGELGVVRGWVVNQLNRDLSALTPSGITPDQQQAYLRNSLRFRAYYTNSSYAARHDILDQAIKAWFAQHKSALGGSSSPLYIGLREHYQVIAVGHGDHEVILSRGDRLLDALSALPPASAATAPPGPSPSSAPAELQRQTARSGRMSEEALPLVDSALRTLGRPLDSATHDFFASRFQHDFKHVRIHDDDRAAASARAVDAKAYTVGRDIVFDKGAYDPRSQRGQRLLAHELTHVVQQGEVRPAAPRIQRQVVPSTDRPIRADEGGMDSHTFNCGQFTMFIPGRYTAARGSPNEVQNVKVHIFFAAGGVHDGENDFMLHGLRGASNQSEWITIGVPGLEGGAMTISDAQIANCLHSFGINNPAVVRLTGHSRGCDSLTTTVLGNLITTPIERVVFLDEAVEHVPLNSEKPAGTPDPDRGSVRLNRPKRLIENNPSLAGKIVSYESTVRSQNALTGASAHVAGTTYHDLNPSCVAAIGVARLVMDAMALNTDIRNQVETDPANRRVKEQLDRLALPPRGSLTAQPSTGTKTNINDFCSEPIPGGTGTRLKDSIKDIRDHPVLITFINDKRLAGARWIPWSAHEFFVAEIAHELTE